jgi:uncharacterized protein (DUF1697 family)
VALLRGINVGGRNKVPMSDLRAAVEEAGHTDVATYIQSGNVVFSSTRPRAEVEADLESVLERRFGFPLVVVVRSHAQLRAVVEQAPRGFGKQPDQYHSDVIFLRSPLTPARAMKIVQLRDEVDQAWTGKGVLYFARLSARRTQSKLSKIVGTPEYALMTIRNWSTTTKLLGLLDERGA